MGNWEEQRAKEHEAYDRKQRELFERFDDEHRAFVKLVEKIEQRGFSRLSGSTRALDADDLLELAMFVRASADIIAESVRAVVRAEREVSTRKRMEIST